MGYTQPIKTLVADGAINEFSIVSASGEKAAQAAAGDTDQLGVVQEILQPVGSTTFDDQSAADGDEVDVHISGYARVKCGAALAAGALFMSDANGQAVLATSTNYALGRTEVAGSAADAIIGVQVFGGLVYLP